MINFTRNKSLLFHIIIGILMSVVIYYMNFIFMDNVTLDGDFQNINFHYFFEQ